MKLEGEHIFNGPRQEVWDMIYDPEVLTAALPGNSKLTRLDATTYDGVMSVRIGPVSGTFNGKLVVSDENPPESCTLTVDGKGAPGFASSYMAGMSSPNSLHNPIPPLVGFSP